MLPPASMLPDMNNVANHQTPDVARWLSPMLPDVSDVANHQSSASDCASSGNFSPSGISSESSSSSSSSTRRLLALAWPGAGPTAVTDGGGGVPELCALDGGDQGIAEDEVARLETGLALAARGAAGATIPMPKTPLSGEAWAAAWADDAMLACCR